MTSIPFAHILRGLLFSAGLLCLTSTSSFAQEGRPQDHSPEGVVRLSDVLSEVRENNPNLAAARLNADALSQRREQVSALPDPTVAFEYQPFSRLQAMDAMRSMWSAEQMIPYPGKLGLRGRIADRQADIAHHESEILSEDLILRAKKAYYDLYRAQQLQAIIDDFEESLSGYVEVAAVRYEVGKGSQQAVLKAQVERNQLAQQLIELRERKRSAAETLARLTNRPGGASYFQRVEIATPPVADYIGEDLIRVAVDRRHEMAALQSASEEADLEVELARKEFRPDFGVGLKYFDITGSLMPGGVGGTDGLAFGASVQIPLQRGRLRAQLREAQIRQAEVEAQREALMTEFQTDIDNLLYALQQETETLNLYSSTLLPQASSTTEAALFAYTSGTSGFLDLLDAERTEFALRKGYEDTLARYLTTAAELERALGLTSLEDLDALTARSE